MTVMCFMLKHRSGILDFCIFFFFLNIYILSIFKLRPRLLGLRLATPLAGRLHVQQSYYQFATKLLNDFPISFHPLKK